MNKETIPSGSSCGASHFIMGRDIFGAEDLKGKIDELEQLMGKLG